jgi:aminoglycoside 2'-N-acetyltransferase I
VTDSIRIELCDGDESWPLVEPLERVVYPPDVLNAVIWREVEWANANVRVLIRDNSGTVVTHVGIYIREGLHEGLPVRIGGIGGVMTAPTVRCRGYASRALDRATGYMADLDADFGLLFCEPHNDRFYDDRRWHAFRGTVLAVQDAATQAFTLMGARILSLKCAPQGGVIDLKGLPW